MWDAAEPTEVCPLAVVGIVEDSDSDIGRVLGLNVGSALMHFASQNLSLCICKMGLITPPTSCGG